MYQALYRKYRPKNLEEVWGQDIIVKTLNNAINKGKINHAYLFAGPRGTGKTSVAKIFAAMVNCEELKNGKICGKCSSCIQKNNTDIIEIDAASNNGVDEIRELRTKVNLVPAYGKYKIYIIDEVHMLTTGAFNALLKTLEEPPRHVIFILATTDPHKIPETILSRCQRFDFKKINEQNIVSRLKQITKNEKIDIDEESLSEIARLSDGGMRDSIGMLDQAIAYAEEKITLQDIHDINGTLGETDLQEIIYQIIEKELDKILQKLDFYNNNGKNFVKLTEEIIRFLRNVLLCKESPKYFNNQNKNSQIYEEIAANLSLQEIIKYIKEFNDCIFDMYKNNNPKLLLELSIIKIINDTETEKPKPELKQEKNKTKKVTTSSTKLKQEQTDSKKKQAANSNVDNTAIINEIKEIRINNTLSQFNKKRLIQLAQKIENLNNYLLDSEMSKYASIILDGTLKAASDENLIFVFPSENTSKIFNNNLIEIEETIKKVLDNHYKVIATDIKHWEKIKLEFNSRKRKYTYQKEEFDLKNFHNHQKTEFSDFEDLIEYQ